LYVSFISPPPFCALLANAAAWPYFAGHTGRRFPIAPFWQKIFCI
jgi:hypothetical protein